LFRDLLPEDPPALNNTLKAGLSQIISHSIIRHPTVIHTNYQ
jgi:hypothetical protein